MTRRFGIADILNFIRFQIVFVQWIMFPSYGN